MEKSKSFTTRITQRLFGKEIQRQVSLAVRALDDPRDRQANLNTYPRDRYDYDRQTVLADALEAWRVNPLARRIVELTSQYVVGGGLSIECSHERTHQFIQEWWSHRLNRMDVRVFEWCDELSRSGELFVVISTDAAGMSYLRAVPAADIEEIRAEANDVEQELEIVEKLDERLEKRSWKVYNAQEDNRNEQAYGRVIHRGQQFHLFGRWHIDSCNAMLFHDYGMEGVKELGRVSALPMQTVARVSPGTGISAMQILTALRLGVLVPWHKQQAERPKTALELLRADQGGMVYQPVIGLHPHVAEVDFISMYPSIMAHFNNSPETVNHISQNLAQAAHKPVNELNFGISAERGLVPQTLEPLLEKRLKLKDRLATLPGWDPRRKAYTAQASAHKWLLVTCFGYLGYKNARFGRIESHEAVTAYGRETLLTAKEAAEDLGGTVLHLYVDGLWVRQAGLAAPSDFQPMVEEIAARTGLPIALDGVYRWVAFLPSRVNERVPVANRYFGVFQDGSLKMRGIEARREDTPVFIARLQVEMLERLARVPDPGPAASPQEMRGALAEALPGLVAFLRRRLRDLRLGHVPLEELLVTQRLSRALDEYKSPSPAARAAAQLAAAGRPLSAGQKVRFLITLGEPGVHAWDLPRPVNPAALDLRRYAELTLRAAGSVVQPLGITEEALKDKVLEDMVRLPLPRKQLTERSYA
jgi:DNA polymerase-2